MGGVVCPVLTVLLDLRKFFHMGQNKTSEGLSEEQQGSLLDRTPTPTSLEVRGRSSVKSASQDRINIFIFTVYLLQFNSTAQMEQKNHLTVVMEEKNISLDISTWKSRGSLESASSSHLNKCSFCVLCTTQLGSDYLLALVAVRY